MSRAAFAALFVFSSAILLFLPGNGEAQTKSIFGSGALTIHTRKGPVNVPVEIAETDDARARGLMFRQSLGERRGMLFLFDKQETITMWMKNTYIPLDMVFIDSERQVVDIARQAEPLSTDVIASRLPALWVLEVAAGQASALGITPGDRVELKR